MSTRIIDKNKGLIKYRSTPSGAVLTKGKKDLYILFASVNESERAKKLIANNSFNTLFKKGKSLKTLGKNVAYIDLKKRK